MTIDYTELLFRKKDGHPARVCLDDYVTTIGVHDGDRAHTITLRTDDALALAKTIQDLAQEHGYMS